MRVKYSFLSLLLFTSLSVSAQKISGLVVSKQTGEVLTGADIKAESTSYRAITGLDGSFLLKQIPKGSYLLHISMVGFQPLNKRVELTGASLELPKIELDPATENLSSVIVTASGDKNDDAHARNLEKNSDRVMNVVSAKAIEISPDITVANVIQRMSGVTVERNNTGDGQYALLRGMDKRYNYTLVNGVKIPSPDNKNRFVPLDIFPAELLDRLEVTKSLTPDMEGDGIGGAINLVMKDAPSRRLVSANISTGGNALFIDRPFYTYNKAAIAKSSPFEIYGPTYPAGPEDFNGNLLNIQKSAFKPNLNGGLSLGDRFLKDKLGVLIAGTYQNSLRGSNSSYYGFTTATSDASNLPVITSHNARTYSEEQTRAGVHAKLDYRLAANHKLQLFSSLMDFKTYQVRDERSTNFSVGYEPEKGNYNLSYDRRFRYNHQKIFSNTLKGEHRLSDQFSIDWSAIYAKATSETPDNSQIHLSSTVRNGVENPKSVVVLGGAERRWEHNSDEDKAGYLNFNYRLGTEALPILLTAGGMYRDKQRTNFFNEYQFRPLDPSKPEGQQKNLVEGTDWNTYSEISFAVFNPTGSTGDPLNYDASEKIAAGYLQAKISNTHFEALGGLRAEHTNQGYYLQHPVDGLRNEGNQKYTDILPSVNFKYKLNEKTNLRASYYKAINRPSFFEIVPYRIINEDFTEAGNPDLKHTIADNADIRYELFPKASEQLLVGAFYKKIKDPIEFGMVLQGQGSYYMPSNFGDATNYGLELDYTKYLHNFGIKVNYTYTHSNITTDKLYYYNNPDQSASEHVLVKNVAQRRSLAGQAAHVGNLTFLYKSVQKGIDAQLSMSYTGDRLYAVSRFIDNDIWESGFVQLDASIEKTVGKHFVTFLKATNLLNTPVKNYVKRINPANQKVQGYETFNGGTVTQSDRYGQTLMIGLRFKL